MSSGSTPEQIAAVAPSSPLGAAGLPVAPGVDLAVGTTSAPASTGTLPAEAFSPGGGYTAGSVDLLGLDLDESFVSGLSVTRLAAAIRALSPEDSANLRAAMAEAEATPDEDT
ncbi:unnamed protein product, partial [Symbiodinium sp. CCMP2456]